MLHPWINEAGIVARRGPWLVLRHVCAGPCLLLAVLVALAGCALVAGLSWCVPMAAVLAVGGSFTITCSALQRVSRQWRSGWWGGAPIAASVKWRTRWCLAGAGWLVACAAVAVALSVIVAITPRQGSFLFTLLILEAGLTVGTLVALGLVAVLPYGWHRSRSVGTIREPVLALRWLHDPGLPHLLDWQRRFALLRWRRGGVFFVAVVVLGMPGGTRIGQGLGEVLLVLSLAWFVMVLQACNKTTAAAMTLLAATPLERRQVRFAALRYPVFAALCAVAIAVVGTFLPGGPALVLGAWAACATALSVWPIWRLVHAASPADGLA